MLRMYVNQCSHFKFEILIFIYTSERGFQYQYNLHKKEIIEFTIFRLVILINIIVRSKFKLFKIL